MRRLHRALRPYHFHLRLLAALVLVCIVSTIAAYSFHYASSRTQLSSTPQTYVRGTSYDGISSRIADERVGSLHYTIEYPTTGTARIDQTVSSYIDQMKRAFSDDFTDPTLTGSRGEFNATYLIRSATQEYISITAQISMSYPMTPLITETQYWTFDRRSGDTIHLADIFGDKSSDGVARTVLYVRQQLRKQASARQEKIGDELLDQIVTADTLTDFLVRDAHTLEFDFDRNTLASSRVQPFVVTIPIDRLQLFMQNDIARKLFDITVVSSARTTTQPVSGPCASRKCIALTFDDGPGPHTTELLDVLKSRGVRASFFDIGSNVRRYPALVKRQADEGHTVGNHTYNHPSLTLVSDDAITREITSTNDAIQAITGRKPRYLRPPNGAINAHVATLVGAQGMTSVLWSVDTRDWAGRNVDIIYNRIIAGARPGSIIILHDIHRTSVETVARSVDKLRTQGYEFVTLDDMLPGAQPGKIYSHL